MVQDLLDLQGVPAITFDDQAMLRRARDDPIGFVNSLPRPIAVDEFQRAGEGFLLAVKRVVDRHRERGQFLLTGSTIYLAARSTTETLAGRAGRAQLWPLSVGERRQVRETFVDSLFELEAWPPGPVERIARTDLVDLILAGGYPEIVTQSLGDKGRRAWFDEYVAEVVSREALRPMADLRLETELRKVLRLLCARPASELVIAELAADAQLARPTVSSYVALLEALFLVVELPAWATRATSKAKRHSKIVIRDTGLAANVARVGEAAFGLNSDGRIAGALFETFVINEIAKQSAWNRRTVDLAHYRDRDGREIDLIVEDRHSGQVVGIEAKLTATPDVRHARHLATLRDRIGDPFALGLVVHSGDQILPLGERLWAVPVSTLWRSDR